MSRAKWSTVRALVRWLLVPTPADDTLIPTRGAVRAEQSWSRAGP